jgi:hypothetical protein
LSAVVVVLVVAVVMVVVVTGDLGLLFAVFV